MERLTIEVTSQDSGSRIDRFLTDKLGGQFSRSHIKKMIDSGCVQIGGTAIKAHRKIRPGEIIDIREPEPQKVDVRPEEIPLDIVFEDGDLIVVNKSAGMVTHPGAGNYEGTLVNALMGHCPALSSVGGQYRPGIVHRLDKGTSGLMVIAKNDSVHKELSKQFAGHTVKKVYYAIVKGIVQLDHGTISAPIGRSSYDRKKMSVRFEESKPAVTNYSVIKRFKDCTLLDIRIETGRTHQIRVHVKYLGYPVLGDETYGGKHQDLKRPALHAKTLGFEHPVSKKYMEFDSELPEDLKGFLKRYETKKT